MTNVIFVSRHPATPAQKATVAKACEKGHQFAEVEATFHQGEVVKTLNALKGHAADYIFVLVAPAWVHLEALRGGLTTGEFQNKPSARSRGVFICEGLHIHTPPFMEEDNSIVSDFTECPVPTEEQEEVSLNSQR